MIRLVVKEELKTSGMRFCGYVLLCTVNMFNLEVKTGTVVVADIAIITVRLYRCSVITYLSTE